MKWEALVAMAALIGVAIWLVAREGDAPLPIRDGAVSVEVRMGHGQPSVLMCHSRHHHLGLT